MASLRTTILSAVFLAAATAAAAQVGYDPMAPRGAPEEAEEVPLNPELGNLPDTEGAEDVYYTCTACHSLAIIKQQRMSDARWDYTIEWMIEEQNMPEPDPETKERIMDYLKRHFSSER